MSAMTVIHGGHPTNGRRRCKSVGVEEDEGICTRCTVASCDPSNHLSLSTSGGQLKELRGSAPGAPSPCLTRPTISTHQLRGSVEGVEESTTGVRVAFNSFNFLNFFNSLNSSAGPARLQATRDRRRQSRR